MFSRTSFISKVIHVRHDTIRIFFDKSFEEIATVLNDFLSNCAHKKTFCFLTPSSSINPAKKNFLFYLNIANITCVSKQLVKERILKHI